MTDTFNPLTFTGVNSDLGALNLGTLPSLNGSSAFPFFENAGGTANTAGTTPGLSTFNDLGSLIGNQLGSQGVQDALGNTSSASASPMSQIFTAIDNFSQRAGFIMLGMILIAIGTWWLARPQVKAVAAKVKAAA